MFLLECVISSQSTWTMSSVLFGDANGHSGSNLSLLNYPSSMYYDRVNRKIIVGDKGNVRILRFSLDNPTAGGTIIAGGNGYGCNLNQFQDISGVALDSVHQLYVIDSSCNRLVKFSASSDSTEYGQLIVTLDYPTAISIDHRTDDIYIALSSGNYSILKFTNNSQIGVTIAGGNGYGSNLNQIIMVTTIYFDYKVTKALYVCDFSNYRVLKFPENNSFNVWNISRWQWHQWVYNESIKECERSYS